jgi:hypothetical protein
MPRAGLFVMFTIHINECSLCEAPGLTAGPALVGREEGLGRKKEGGGGEEKRGEKRKRRRRRP